MTKFSKQLIQGVGVSLLVALTSPSGWAAPGTLETIPLFATTSVPPNVVLLIDDSGSMDYEVLVFTNDGALWWNSTTPVWTSAGSAAPHTMTTRGQTFIGIEGPYSTTGVPGTPNFNRGGSASSPWYRYVYLFPNGTATGARVLNDSFPAHAIPPLPQYAFMRSPEYNAAYFDPDATYDPWPSYSTTTYADITATAAPSDPVAGGGNLNLTGTLSSGTSNWTFKMLSGMSIPSGTTYSGATGTTINGGLRLTSSQDVNITYKPATYYLTLERAGGSGVTPGNFSYTISYIHPSQLSNNPLPAPKTVTGNCATHSPDHYDLFNFAPGGITFSPNTINGKTIKGLAPDGRCLVEYPISSGTTEMQNFANWFSYYRKRHLALRGGIVSAFRNVLGVRMGVHTINNSVTDLLPPVQISTSGSTEQNSLFAKIYSIDGNSGGTPNREGLKYVGDKYMISAGSSDALVVSSALGGSCQKNFAIQFTDGYTIPNSISGIANDDSGEGSPYADSYSDSLADIAMYFYKTNIQTGLTYNKVPVRPGCPTPSTCSSTSCRSNSTTNPIADCNRNPHMNTITVGLGAAGTIFNSALNNYQYETVADIFANPTAWPDISSDRSPVQIDDLYHAAVNGRGEVLNARTPAELTSAMQTAVKTVFQQVGVSSAVTFNTSRLTTASRVYLSLFNGADWSGDLLAYDLVALTNSAIAGTSPPDPLWRAADILEARTSERVILTNNGGGVPFRWNNLSTAQKNDLKTNISGVLEATDTNGQARLAFIRGDHTNEGTGLKFRIRGNKLGDIVYSNATYVPSTGTGQPAMIYVGANDGMLHGFNAETGEELLAYIPSNLYSTTLDQGLHYLTNPDYHHRFYVDQSPVVAKIGTKTILVGGERAGGRGYFALDISSPSTFSESNAASIVLWEFTNTNDADLGYTFSMPTIAKLSDSSYGVIFGNGYNSDFGRAELFILRLNSNGSLNGYYEILANNSGDSATDKNGMSTPGVIDVDFNGKADWAYVGDVKGNLWAFDLDPIGSITYSKLFAAASNQPITAEPIITKNPAVVDTLSPSNQPNVLVLFGTGQYLAQGDATTTYQQTFYGVWHDGSTTTRSLSNLVQQTITENGDNRAVLTVNPVNYPPLTPAKYGWYINLPTSKERVVTTAMVRGKTVFFNTLTPSTDPCSYGGDGWLMAVNLADGGGTVDNSGNAKPVFDRNGDEQLDQSDLCYKSGTTLTCPSGSWTPGTGQTPLAAVGQKFKDRTGISLGLPAQSSFTKDHQYTPGTRTTDGSSIHIRKVEEVRQGRLTWQELIGN